MGNVERYYGNFEKLNDIFKRLRPMSKSGENKVDLLNRYKNAFKDENKGREDDLRSRPPGKQRATKKTKSGSTSGTTGSNTQDFQEFLQNEFAVRDMYAVSKEKDWTIMWLE
ncbi:hypothetical protein Tco_0092256 [Tanacetum coccineum]